jgi:hypothetical protein
MLWLRKLAQDQHTKSVISIAQESVEGKTLMSWFTNQNLEITMTLKNYFVVLANFFSVILSCLA